MIESSIIKLILIAVLNICFVWVWVKKENLRKKDLSKIKNKLEKKLFFKKYEKIMTFIGNINIFWILNISYFLLIKVFEKELNLILGFPEGITKDVMFETNVLKPNHVYSNSLDEVTKFIFDTGNIVTLFIGVTALMIPIYIYIIELKTESKRQLLLMVTRKGNMFYLSFFIYGMLFFKVEKLFLVGAIGYLIYLLMEAVKWIMEMESKSYEIENLEKILKRQEKDELKKLYETTLENLEETVSNGDKVQTINNEKMLFMLLENNLVDLRDTGNLIRSLYDIYDVSIKTKNDDIFRKVSYLHIKIAKYYLRNNDKENFYWALCGMGKVYDYHYKNGTDKFELRVIDAFRFDYLGIWKKYKENLKEGIEWYSQVFKAITEGIKKAVINEDFYFFQQFTYLIGHQFKHKKEVKKDYKLLEKSVYFGILMYLKEEKRK